MTDNKRRTTKREDGMKKVAGFVILGVVLLLLSGIVFSSVGMIVNIYNTIIKSEQIVKNNVENLDAEYQRRYALVDNFVEIVKSTKGFESLLVDVEKEIYIKTAGMKASATKMDVKLPDTIKQRISKENALGSILTNVLDKIAVMAQHYPEIRDPVIKDRNSTFLALDNLRQELKNIEENILISRKNLNNSVKVYNQNIRIFPANLFCASWGFNQMEGFSVINAEARKDVKIKF